MAAYAKNKCCGKRDRKRKRGRRDSHLKSALRKTINGSTPAQQAREDAGMTVAQAARRVRISKNYLRQIERHGNTPYVLATRLARLYHCSIEFFL